MIPSPKASCFTLPLHKDIIPSKNPLKNGSLMFIDPLGQGLISQEPSFSLEQGGGAIRAAYQPILVAVLAPPHPPLLLYEQLPAPAAVSARNEPDTAAAPAQESWILAGNPVEQPAKLAGLVELPQVFRPADVRPADEDLGKRRRTPLAAEQRLELVPVGGVHGDVPLVDGDAEAAEDGADGAAVLVRAPDAAEGGGVDNDAGIGRREFWFVVGEILPEETGRVAGAAVGGVVVGEGSREKKGLLRGRGRAGSAGGEGVAETIHEIPG
ncbi:hypothetical protein AXF42_Ash020403 [Apostasia shenzhenica]|uniref:Uncharacterized protein n=1 Tax=Apostasia shenzhenica TaxID=1088818 RepID=A0A2I0AA60_9ASPA|nr:hypothetical protein AXF42_Ash020403 [Apostasia shenzhenica]